MLEKKVIMINWKLLYEAILFYSERLPAAIFVTIYVTIGATAIGMILGLLLAFMRDSKNSVISSLSEYFTNITRVVPIPPFLYLIYFGFLMLIYKITPEIAGMLALGILLSPVMGELYRSGIQSVDRGYIEAGEALGMSSKLVKRRVIIPIAIRIMMPAIGQKVVGTLLDSAFVSVLGGRDITGVGRKVVNTLFATELYLIIAGIYFVISFPISRLFSAIERRQRFIL